MAIKSDGSVILDTRLNTDGFGKGVQSMKQKVGGLTSAVGKLGLAIGAAFSVVKLVQFGKEAIDLGSDLQEVQNVVDVVFGNMSEDVNEFAENALEQFGLSEYSAKQYASTLGAMFKSFGFMTQDAKKMSLTLTGLAGDMASFYNLDSEDAFAKLRAGISGETEPLKQLGINLSVANLEQFALQKGIEKTYNSMSELEKVMLRYNYILYATTQSQGDFARTSDSWANQTRILSETFNEFKRNIGQALINIFTPFLKVLNQIVAKMAEFSKGFVAFSEMLVGKSTSGGGGSPGEVLEGISDGYNDIADATEEATKAQKRYLSGLDEIRTFQSTKEENGLSGGIAVVSPNNTNEENENLKETVGIIDIIKRKIDELKIKFPILIDAFEIISNGFELAKSSFNDFVGLLAAPFVGNKEGFIEYAKNIGGFLYEIFEKAIIGFREFSEKFLSTSETTISPVVKNISKDISELASDFFKWFNEDMAPVLERWGQKFDELWGEDINQFGEKVIGLIANISEDFGLLWDELLKPAFDDFVNNVLPIITPAIEELGNVFMETFGDIISVIGFLLDTFGGIISFLVGAFTNDWEKCWEGLKEIFIGVINIIIVAIEGFVNTFINAVNSIINGFNGIRQFLGKDLFPTIPEFDIPEIPVINVAYGSVVPPNASISARKNFSKSNISDVSPDELRKIVREESGKNESRVLHNYLYLDSRLVYEGMIDEAKMDMSTTGRNPFDLK